MHPISLSGNSVSSVRYHAANSILLAMRNRPISQLGETLSRIALLKGVGGRLTKWWWWPRPRGVPKNPC